MDLPCPEWQKHVEGKWGRLSDAEKTLFASLTDVEDVFAYCQSLTECRDTAVLTHISTGEHTHKDSVSAASFRALGNASFRAREYTTAAHHYSRGVCLAPQGSQELPLCYANRSAALLHLAHYQECLEDISRALRHDYPAELKGKLLRRQEQCLGYISKAGEPQSPTLQRRVSPSVSLRHSSEKGRHMVARESMARGEEVLQESSFTCVLIPGEGTQDWHCHHCLLRTLNPVPCPTCSYARYCGDRCLQEAWAGHHRWECPVGAELHAVGVMAHLAVRVALRAGFEEVQKLRGQAQRTSSTEDMGGSYPCVYNLLPHVSGHAPSMRFLCAVTIATLCQLLRPQLPATWVGSETSNGSVCQTSGAVWWWQLSMLGAVVLRHMLQLRCNAQAVTVLRSAGDGSAPVQAVQEERVATAVFPTLSLLNHSCLPNVSVAFTPTPARGVMVTVRTTRAVAAGEELLHCYGPRSSRMCVVQRQRLLLEQYFFVCQCDSCVRELASEDEGQRHTPAAGLQCERCQCGLQRDMEGYRCTVLSCSFLLCAEELSRRLRQLQSLQEHAVLLVEKEEPEEALRVLEEATRGPARILTHTHMLWGQLKDTTARAHAVRGEWQQAAVQLSLSVPAVVAQYGEDSAELGRQLFKLVQLHFNGGELHPALSLLGKTRRLLTLHLGPTCEELQELSALEDCAQGAL